MATRKGASRGRLECVGLALAATIASFGLSCADRDRIAGEPIPTDEGRPAVVSSVPADSATATKLLPTIRVVFSEPMSSPTIQSTTVGLTGLEGHGRVTYDAATFTAEVQLDTLLAPDTRYTIAVTEAATDLEGRAALPFTSEFRTGPFSCENISDALEPNSDLAVASPVAVDRTVRSLTICGEDIDYYRLTLDTARKVRVRTPILDASIDSAGSPGWQIHFMRDARSYYATLGTSAEVGGAPSYEYSFLPGTYLVEIYSSYGLEPGESILYDLEVTGSEACEDDVYEDNDFPDQAALLSAGRHEGLRGCYVDEDNYAIEMTAGKRLRLTIDATIPGDEWAHRRVHLRAPGADTETYSGTENPVVLEATAAADGRALIDTRFWTDGVEYVMTLEFVD